MAGENDSKAQIAESNAELAKREASANELAEVSRRQAEPRSTGNMTLNLPD